MATFLSGDIGTALYNELARNGYNEAQISEFLKSSKGIVCQKAIAMCKGYVVSEAPMLPAEAHYSRENIFNKEKLAAYVFNNFNESSIKATHQITADSLQQFSERMEAKMEVSGSYGFGSGASVAASIKGELGVDKAGKEELHYAQHRKVITYGNVSLPGSTFGLEEIQSLMEPKVLDFLEKKVLTDEIALKLVKDLGPFYFDNLTFGATSIMTSTMKSSSSTSSDMLSAAISASYSSIVSSASGSAEIKVNTSKSGEKASSTVTTKTMGGDTAAFYISEADWERSAKVSPVIISYKLAPISNLVSNEKSKELLEKAIKGYLSGFVNELASLDMQMKAGSMAMLEIDRKRADDERKRAEEDARRAAAAKKWTIPENTFVTIKNVAYDVSLYTGNWQDSGDKSRLAWCRTKKCSFVPAPGATKFKFVRVDTDTYEIHSERGEVLYCGDGVEERPNWHKLWSDTNGSYAGDKPKRRFKVIYLTEKTFSLTNVKHNLNWWCGNPDDTGDCKMWCGHESTTVRGKYEWKIE